MIQGTVMPWHEAVVQLTVTGEGGREVEVAAIVDTGFSGSLLLPREVVAELGLVLEDVESVVLTDGSERDIPLYRCTVAWDGRPRRVSALCAEGDVLIGMSMIWGHLLTVRAADHGEVIIQPLG